MADMGHVLRRMLADARTQATPQDPAVIDYWVGEVLRSAEVERKETRIQELEGLLRKSRLDHLSTCGELEEATAEIKRMAMELSEMEGRLRGCRDDRNRKEADILRLRYAVAMAAAWLPGPERATVLDQARMTEHVAARLNDE